MFLAVCLSCHIIHTYFLSVSSNSIHIVFKGLLNMPNLFLLNKYLKHAVFRILTFVINMIIEVCNGKTVLNYPVNYPFIQSPPIGVSRKYITFYISNLICE